MMLSSKINDYTIKVLPIKEGETFLLKGITAGFRLFLEIQENKYYFVYANIEGSSSNANFTAEKKPARST